MEAHRLTASTQLSQVLNEDDIASLNYINNSLLNKHFWTSGYGSRCDDTGISVPASALRHFAVWLRMTAKMTLEVDGKNPSCEPLGPAAAILAAPNLTPC